MVINMLCYFVILDIVSRMVLKYCNKFKIKVNFEYLGLDIILGEIFFKAICKKIIIKVSIKIQKNNTKTYLLQQESLDFGIQTLKFNLPYESEAVVYSYTSFSLCNNKKYLTYRNLIFNNIFDITINGMKPFNFRFVSASHIAMNRFFNFSLFKFPIVSRTQISEPGVNINTKMLHCQTICDNFLGFLIFHLAFSKLIIMMTLK